MKNKVVYFSVLLLCLFVGISPVYAGYEEREAAYQRGDYETAFQEFKPLAEQGDELAQYKLGIMYDAGRGVEKDGEEAFKWYEKAAGQGNAVAQSKLGLMYEIGEDIGQDDEEAFEWHRKAAKQGNALSQYKLGVMYMAQV